MPTKDKKKAPPKKKTFELSDKGFKEAQKAEKNKMKIYGDVPDSRPKGRVLTPQMMSALRRKRGKNV